MSPHTGLLTTHASIYKKENAINLKVQLKVLLNVFLGF